MASLPRALDRLDVVNAAAIPMRAEFSIIKSWTGFLTLHASGHSVAGANAAGASSSPQLFSPEREGRIGNKEIALAVMPITEIAGDVRIDAARRPGMARRL